MRWREADRPIQPEPGSNPLHRMELRLPGRLSLRHAF
jgi:hypothetical protein